MSQIYNGGTVAAPSTISNAAGSEVQGGFTYGEGAAPTRTAGTQFNPHYYFKKALVEIAKDTYFTALADVKSMPKHFGKTMKQYHYLPLLDDANVNDQGIDATGSDIAAGNLYGSSKDIGSIPGKLPVLSESGGRVNRVGFTRIDVEGSLEKLGFFYEFTQESLDFDTDAELFMHLTSESLKGANEIVEDMLQIDLLNSAGVIRYCGAASSKVELSGESADSDGFVTYDDIMRLSIDLDNNRTPKQTTMIMGSRMIDTKVLFGCRLLYIGNEMVPTIKKMADNFGNQAFIGVQHYAKAGSVIKGEIGSIDNLRIVVHPEMQHHEGAGAAVTANLANARNDGSNYNVYPLLSVGEKSFSTIGFQTDGKSVKFKITTKMPGEAIADRQNPYGEVGFSSIKWYYGFMLLRAERIGVIWSLATE